MSVIVIHGPAGCGKTRNAERLRKIFGCRTVVDGWAPGGEAPASRAGIAQAPQNVLVLTNASPDEIRSAFPAAHIVRFEEAMR